MIETPLETAVLLGGIGLILELLAVLFRVHFIRRVYYLGAMIFTAFSVTLVFLVYPSFPAIVVAIIALYRIVNAIRVLSRYVDEDRSFTVTNRTSFVLVLLQIISICILLLSQNLGTSAYEWLRVLLWSAFGLSVLLVLTTLHNLKRTLVRPSDKYTPDVDLPTVSVCIPARNETADLPACLAQILASDYPKLEVLVYDDCSQDNTSEIIKGFAHDGVRFIAGEKPKKGWLAKNQAYQALAEAASGDLLLFCGVDVRFDKRAIRYLVATLIARHKQMLSVLPKNPHNRNSDGLIQPMRYWWELALPRKVFNRPPVLSTLWLIDKDALQDLGYFKAVSNTVIPEAFIAREIARNDEYTFMRSNGKLEIQSVKNFDEQWDTAIRLHYPQFRKRPESVLLATLVELWLFILPLSVFIVGFFMRIGLLWSLAGLTLILLGYIHHQILKAMGAKQLSQLLLSFPIACAIEIAITQLSMWRYEFGEVEWKERNICIPVMQAIKQLPKA
jgi:chlorobactene glucosyltransferase